MALDVYYANEQKPGETPLEFCIRNGWADFIYKMLVVDFLILNRDRHGANIEVLRDRKNKEIRLAPLFDHGLSLLCRCRTEQEIEKYDILEDKPVQCFVGSRSAYENLSLIPKDKFPKLNELKESFEEKLNQTKEDVTTEYTEKIENMKKEKENLENIPKTKLVKRIGILQRDDSEFKESLKQAFIDGRKLFFEANDITENDILSIKKDAIFMLKNCKYQEFGHILFRPKNRYSSYLYLKLSTGNLELYYSDKSLDVKGIASKHLENHEKYLLKFFRTFFRKMETDSNEEVLRYLNRFISKYKRRELETGYYRSFDNASTFILDDVKGMEFIDEESVVTDNIMIEFNYYEIFMKLVKVPL